GEADLRLLVPLRQGAEGLRLASRVARAHQLESFRRADPLWAATWSVLSLRISYCGSSSLARRVWPLYSKSWVWTSVIVPETCPASEFQLTWSPTANFVLMRGLLDSRAPSLTPGEHRDAEEHRRLALLRAVAVGPAGGDPAGAAGLDDLHRLRGLDLERTLDHVMHEARQRDACAALVDVLAQQLPFPGLHREGLGVHRVQQHRPAARARGPDLHALGGIARPGPHQRGEGGAQTSRDPIEDRDRGIRLAELDL